MTQWVENPTGGRDRGPVAVLRAWAEILVRPRRFFAAGVAPGDQAPGLVFAAAVLLIEEGSRFAVVRLAEWGLVSTGPFAYPAVSEFSPGIALLALLGVIIFVMPATVHLTAALQTLLLVPVAENRGGVSETVQVMCYAMAPCVLAGLPFPELQSGRGRVGRGPLHRGDDGHPRYQPREGAGRRGRSRRYRLRLRVPGIPRALRAGLTADFCTRRAPPPVMLSLDIDDFMLELKDGAFKNIGASNKQATVKLYDVEGVDVRAFGDERVKIAFEDEDGSEVEVALFPEQARAVAEGLELVESESDLFD